MKVFFRSKKKNLFYSSIPNVPNFSSDDFSFFRNDAKKEIEKRIDKITKSKQLFQMGDKRLAKIYSDEAKIHDHKYKMLNRIASEKIFKLV